jgi:hypothetical membrane protein
LKIESFESHSRFTRFATLGALLGAALLAAGISFAIVSYNHNRALQTYSPVNHAISELGFPAASRLTWLFNGTVAIGGLLLLPVNFALAARLRTGLGHAAARCACLGALSLSGLGLFGLRQDFLQTPYLIGPYFRIHMIFAGVFFLAWSAAISLFTIAFCRRGRDSASRLMALAGIMFCVVFGALLLVTICLDPAQMASFKDFKTFLQSPPTTAPILSRYLDAHRPRIFWQMVTEWTWAGLVLFWHIAAVTFLWRRNAEMPQR